MGPDMTDLSLGKLSLGRVPRVVGTISTRESLPLSPGLHNYICDVVEVRLDALHIANDAWLDNCVALEKKGFPVILTIRLKAEGGKWTGEDGAREPIFSAALSRLTTIDIELDSELMPKLCESAESCGKPVIISYHDFQRTPALEELKSVVSRMRECPSAIPKIATMVVNDEDVKTLKQLLETMGADGPLCLIGMGAESADTRIEFPRLGSCLTYGYIDTSCAPGQWPSDQLVQHLRELIPEYNQEFIAAEELPV